MIFESKIGPIYYQEHGSHKDRTLVFIHGAGMDHRTFLPQVSALQEDYRIVLLDLPGHSSSCPIPKRLPYSKTAAEVLLELLDFLQIQRAILIGQSLGSFVAQYAAAADPDRIIASVHLGGGSLYPKYTKLLNILQPTLAVIMRLYPSRKLITDFLEYKNIRLDLAQFRV